MQCVMCQHETHLSKAYALPSLVRVSDAIQNLYACSIVCREEWLFLRNDAAPPQVLAIQPTIQLDAPRVNQLSFEETLP